MREPRNQAAEEKLGTALSLRARKTGNPGLALDAVCELEHINLEDALSVRLPLRKGRWARSLCMETIQAQRLVGRRKLPRAGLPGVLPERLVERAELDTVLSSEAPASLEVRDPEADRVCRTALLSQGLERTPVEDRIEPGEGEMKQRRANRDTDPRELGQRSHPFGFIIRGEGDPGLPADRGGRVLRRSSGASRRLPPVDGHEIGLGVVAAFARPATGGGGVVID